MPAVVTVIDSVVSPVFHNKEPLNPEAVRTELPQLFTTSIVGANGMTLGTAAPLPGALVHPFRVCVARISSRRCYCDRRSCSTITP